MCKPHLELLDQIQKTQSSHKFEKNICFFSLPWIQNTDGNEIGPSHLTLHLYTVWHTVTHIVIPLPLTTTHNTTWILMSRTRYKISCNLGTRRKISNAPVANHLCFTFTKLRSSPLYALLMTLCSFIIPHVSLLLESVETLAIFACPVGVKVCIHLGDCKIKDAKQESALL